MIKYYITALFCLFTVSLFAQFSVTGGNYPAFKYDFNGYDGVFIVNGGSNLSLTYRSMSDAPISWFRYSVHANDYQAVASTQNGTMSIVHDPLPGYGYFVSQANTVNRYMWLIDYQSYALKFNAFTTMESDDKCQYLKLILKRNAPEIPFYSINGASQHVERFYQLTYDKLVWNQQTSQYEKKVETINDEGDMSEYVVDAPFCNTIFTLKGDQFLRYWGIEKSISSNEYQAVSVTGKAVAEQLVRENGNEWDKKTGEFGGSGPIDMRFTAITNSPVATYNGWQFSKTEKFEVIDMTYNESQFNYSFTDLGTTYVRLKVSNSSGSCEYFTNPIKIQVEESKLEVPNVFTPGTSPGANDEFKVAYKSLIKFEAWVFNRYGVEMFHWTDPARGWDGRYNGKYCPTGAYFYVIEAQGTEGKQYKLKGDINLIRSR